ncbi:hypothetical protein FJTKL_10288 [Diaporthe vaccinii]|uniref:Uncharacterized protein n=1 Tax=Diaporthe vaccinii TaxID=105482 RepID=A0ABR4EKG4_9PEZI
MCIKGDGRTYTKFKLGILSCSAFARCTLHPSHVPSATSEPVGHATNPEPDCHLKSPSPGDAGVESHHKSQHIASLCSLAQYHPPEGIPRSVASSGRPALLFQRGQRSLSLAIGPHVDRQVSASIFSIHHCIHLAFETLPIYVIEINMINSQVLSDASPQGGSETRQTPS